MGCELEAWRHHDACAKHFSTILYDLADISELRQVAKGEWSSLHSSTAAALRCRHNHLAAEAGSRAGSAELERHPSEIGQASRHGAPTRRISASAERTGACTSRTRC